MSRHSSTKRADLEVYVSEGEPQHNVHLPETFEPRRLKADGSHPAAPSKQKSQRKDDALRALFNSVSTKDGKRVYADGLRVIISKLMCATPISTFFGASPREVSEEHAYRVMSFLDRRSAGHLTMEDFCEALDVCVRDDGQPSKFHHSLLMADALALHEHNLDLEEEVESLKETHAAEKAKLTKQVDSLRQELLDLEQQNTDVLDEADTEMNNLQRQNMFLKTELVRARSHQNLADQLAPDDGENDMSVCSFDRRDSAESIGVVSQTSELDALRDEIATLTEQLAQLSDELVEEKSRSTDLQDQLLAASEALQRAEHKNTLAETQLSSLTADLNRVTAELKDLKARPSRTSLDISGMNYAMALGIELQVEAMRTENSNLKKENTDLKQRLLEHEATAQEKQKELEATVAKLRAQMVEMEKRHAVEAEATQDEVNVRLSRKNEELREQLKTQAKEATARQRDMELRVKMLREQLAQTEKQLKQADASASTIKLEVQSLRARLRAREDAGTQIATLQQELKTATADKHKLSSCVEQLHAKLRNAEFEQTKQAQHIQALEADQRAQTRELERLRRQSSRWGDQQQQQRHHHQQEAREHEQIQRTPNPRWPARQQQQQQQHGSVGEPVYDQGRKGRRGRISLVAGKSTADVRERSAVDTPLRGGGMVRADDNDGRGGHGTGIGGDTKLTEEMLKLREDNLRLQDVVTALKRVQTDLMGEVSRLRKLLSMHTNLQEQPKQLLKLDDVLESVSKIRQQQRTAALEQMEDLAAINRTLQGAYARSRMASQSFTADRFASSSETDVYSTESNSPTADAASVYGGDLYGGLVRETGFQLSPAHADPVSFDVVCHPSTAAYTFGLQGPCRLVLSENDVRIQHMSTRRQHAWPWHSIARLVRDEAYVSLLVDGVDGRELELLMYSDEADRIAKTFSLFV
ncbi:hypothetical protein PTSG_11026 [Salpingoeca rosetta]|uniref:EF-hand domain-containing protein n=1 Tax=Salpingoeca rosetta (strain ATCC 50818 / BSB-021) TaxID=946362 RepID=F2USH2_SALR5|nr:uncharacterized protein PTSG_11026 [Salpingoeca rosetta]EGD81081.1 hypothetical protein PTSG_11026 [Salpingoeca rosetta]|eukprot:XP_004987950.1 hypothetical protein PTSG_11026 [Salpingoeca rosetta]